MSGKKRRKGKSEQFKEIFFGDVQLLQDFIEQPPTDFTVRGNGSCPAVWMFPPSMAALLSSLLKSKLHSDPF